MIIRRRLQLQRLDEIKALKKIFNKQDLISRNLSIFDRFSNKSLNVICNSLYIDFDAESQTSILSIDDFIKEKRKQISSVRFI
jgi:hypothetical protein